jgi:hypothetical protein
MQKVSLLNVSESEKSSFKFKAEFSDGPSVHFGKLSQVPDMVKWLRKNKKFLKPDFKNKKVLELYLYVNNNIPSLAKKFYNKVVIPQLQKPGGKVKTMPSLSLKPKQYLEFAAENSVLPFIRSIAKREDDNPGQDQKVEDIMPEPNKQEDDVVDVVI